ncbi:ABC transporter ATP-binding protein [Paenibacillus sp. FSL R7-277]|uniref:ABC transporter ATP-binding protein n=1 Tax=Paenibacillus sp. FSL R7-277 TaxID=1227352 RepID=UPI0003E1DEC2|nr:ABC transporter ATP-binding protein [Paenibacillus sp. FSL R7-277]ETT63297.1 ABC transporter ATP-binding protein [Paenibacillus sp. FSL R7-277]
MINISNLSYAFGTGSSRTPVFSELSMNVQRGEFISVVGGSGCGKSTLFKIIAGLLEPDNGRITLNGAESATAAKRLGSVAYMPQQDLLLPWRTVMDNCLLPWELKRSRPKAAAVAEIRTLLQRFGLEGTEGAYPQELSGGMRQRVAVLRTVAAGNDLLLLDEPFGALDAITKRSLQRWLLELWAELDKTVLFITHDLEEALLLSDRIYLMTGSGGGMQEFPAGLPRPRHHSLNYQPQFAALRQELELKLYENRRS